MYGFKYRDKSTENIIGTPLMLVNFDAVTPLGSSRSKIEGERTVSHFVTNEHGTLYDPLSFSYGLIKQDGEPFTPEEARKIETWLTSPKLSSELTVTDCFDVECSYFGLFTSTEWQPGNGSLTFGLLFTFSVNGAYPYRHFNELVFKETDPIITGSIDPATGLPYAEHNRYIYLNCQSDELEEYVYPIIRVKALSSDYTSSFILRNDMPGYPDFSRELKVTTEWSRVITLDCQHCIVYECDEFNGEYINKRILKYKEIGWQNLDYIYWPKLVAGENVFWVNGNVTMHMEYYAPYKKIGGWAV